MAQIAEYEGTFTLQWHITHRCNLRCTHCYQDDYTSFEDRASLIRVLDQYEALLKEYHKKGILNITGGEPLTHPDLFWLLEEAAKRGMQTGVLTNGTLIGLYEAKRLRACGVDYVQVSLDGVEKTHDAIRGRGSFQRAVNGISLLRSQGLFTSVSFTAQRENYRELPKLARFCSDIGASKLWFDRVIIPADEDKNKLSLTAEDFAKLSRRAAHLNRRRLVSCSRALQFIPCKDKDIYHCSAGENLLIVLADGSVMACRRLPIVIGNVSDSDLLTLHRSAPEMLALRTAGIPEGCRDCAYAELCRGGAKCVTFARTGRYDLPDPDCPLAKK